MIRSLTALALLLALACVAAPAARAQMTTSSACLADPYETAYQWMELFPEVDNEFCLPACNTWKRTCYNMANASYRCYRSLFLSLNDLEIAECADNGTDKGGCRNNSQMNFDSLIEDLQHNLRDAQAMCEDNFDDCLDFCNYD